MKKGLIEQSFWGRLGATCMMHQSGSQNFAEFDKMIEALKRPATDSQMDGVSLTEKQAEISKALDDLVADMGTLSHPDFGLRYRAMTAKIRREFPLTAETQSGRLACPICKESEFTCRTPVLCELIADCAGKLRDGELLVSDDYDSEDTDERGDPYLFCKTCDVIVEIPDEIHIEFSAEYRVEDEEENTASA